MKRIARPGLSVSVRLCAAVTALVAGVVTPLNTSAHALGRDSGPPAVQKVKALPAQPLALAHHAAAGPISAQPVRHPRASWPPAATADLADALAVAPGTKPTTTVGPLTVTTGPGKPGGPSAASAQVRILDHAASVRAHVDGVLFALSPLSGSALPPVSRLALDYSGFASMSGAGYGARLHLVTLPACALTTPSVARCQVQTPVESVNDGRSRTLIAIPGGTAGTPRSAGRPQRLDLSAATTPVVLAAVAGSAGSNGTFAASSLGPSGTWSVSGASGAFTWSYPITVPPAAGGGDVAPSVSLSYDSAAVDGRVASTNNQPSWIGEGWDYSPGYIERTYRTCADDTTLPSAAQTQDLCWAGQIVTMNLGGVSTPLVRDDATGAWHPANDSGQRVELVGAGSGGYTNEYWRITATDGIQYYFGRQSLPGAPQSTNSTWTEPVYAGRSTDPCYNATFSLSRCTQAWRWNLDFVEDPHHNATAYYYNAETNYYGANGATTGVAYTRGGYLDHIDYGLRDAGGTAYATVAPRQVTFTDAERCLPDASFSTCDAAHFTAANASHWPDTPQDQQCTSGVSCANHAPTFWTTKRLTTISTQYWTGSGTTYQLVDSYALGQCFPNACPTDLGGDPELLLTSITRTGYSGSTSITEPAITFGHTMLANRVSGYNSQPPMPHFRLSSIVSETGSHTTVSYGTIVNGVSAPCTSTHVPASQAQNSYPCFPVYWTLPYQTTQTLDYFHKYVVTEVDVSDPNALAPTHVSTYTYLGSPAWHFDDNEVVKPANRAWAQFRGYQKVQVRTGNANSSSNGAADKWTMIQTTYFRGMDGDRKADGTSNTGVTVPDSLGGAVADNNLYADTAREVQTFNGAGGAELATSITDPTIVLTSGSRARSGLTALTSDMVSTAGTRTYTDLAAGGQRLLQTSYSYDGAGGGRTGRLLQQADSGTGVPTVCTTFSYADNTTSWIRNRVSEQVVSQQACPAYGTAPSPILSDSRSYYDGSTILGALAATGPADPTQTLTATTTSHWAKATAAFDGAGRQTAATVFLGASDTTGRTTTTAYTTDPGGQLVGRDITNAANQTSSTTFEPGRGSPTDSTDVAGRITTAGYDALGRLTSVWQPGQVQGTDPASATYSYLLQNNGPEAVTARTLVDPGNQTAPSYVTSISIYDQLGQLRQTQTDGVGGGRVVTDTYHDSHGWVIRTNNRWYTTGTPGTTPITTSDSAIDSRTLATYDGAGRPVLSTEYQGITAKWSTKTVYGGDRTTVVPPTGGVESTAITDARGNTVELDQWTTAPTISGNVLTGGIARRTTYQYTVLGQQLGMTTAAGTSLAATWSSTYDLAGRITAKTDPDSGSSSSSYDDTGAVITTTDANSHTLGYSYDDLGRKTGEYDGGLTGPQLAGWTYDTLQAGQLTASTRYTSTGNYVIAATGYDAAGNLTGTSTTLPPGEVDFGGTLNADNSRTFTTGYTWTGSHLMASQTPAAGGSLPVETIQYGYDDHGDPVTAMGINAYVSASSWSSYGEANQYTLGGSVQSAWLTYTRDPQTRRILTTDLSAKTATPQLEHTVYSYDPAGNITRSVETEGGATGAPTETQCYRYDTLDQLTQAWSATDGCTANPATAGNATVGGPQPYWTSWTLDAAGNRTQQVQHALPGSTSSTTTNYTPGVAGHAHALASTSTTGSTTASTSYTYNSDGSTKTRVLASGTQTLAYTEEGRTASVTTAAGTVSYLYGADGDQLIRRGPATSTLYLPGEELTRNNSTGAVTGTRYYSHGGRVVSLRTGRGNPQYLYSDLHGSAQVAVPTTTTGTATPIRRYLDPYGNPLGVITGGTWPDQHAFLDKPKDATSGLSDLGAREYDSALGRFLSVDPLLDPANPLQSNGYSYAANNPVTFSDPTGLMQACEGPCHGSTRGGSAPTGLASPPPASHSSQCSAANGGDAAACNVTNTATTQEDFDPGPPSGDHCIAGPGACDAKSWHHICDRQTCEVVPSNVWVIPGDEWTLVQDWRAQDREELGGLLLMMSIIVGPEARGALRAPAVAIEDETYVSPWLSAPLERGRLIERMFGARGDNSPVVDLVQNGVATSIKSLDLRTKTYQSSSKLESKLKGYVNKVARYEGGRFGNGTVRAGEDFTQRSLLLALPEGAATQAQQQVLAKMFSYAMNNGVSLDVRFVK